MGGQGSKKPEGLNNKGLPTRVLIVDDEELVRKLTEQVVKSVGYEVVGEAVNGKHCVQVAGYTKPDIIILDVKMPTMDGFEALVELRKTYKDVKILMLTSENDKETVTKILKAGADGYMLKPIERLRLLERLRAVRGLPV